MKWMIYGANGYTGELIAREAVRRNERPVLAGRNAHRIGTLATELGCESRVFDVDRPRLDGISLVLHCAGPFVHTSQPMVRACLDAGAHYLDITGEISVFESIMKLDADAKQRGVTLLPGVGFDVVPSDCLAAMLKARVPDAVDLILAFTGGAGVSAGTQKTIIEGLREGGAIRRDGVIVRVPVLHDTRQIPFPSGSHLAMTIPWGDVSTAFHTTGIPNIRVYRATSRRAAARLRKIRPFLPILASPPVKWILRGRASRQAGPDAGARERGHMELWGCASNTRGGSAAMSMRTPEGYALTVLTAIESAMRVLHEPVQAGSLTPARRFGADFITTFPGVTVS